jgi:hypothetical protein
MQINVADLKKLVGKEISTICPHKYVGANNCAHFVGHALGVQIGILCNLVSKKNNKQDEGRASIRVNDIYNDLDDTGRWESRPEIAGNQNLLIFVTSAKNLNSDEDVMNDNPYKHIGIFAEDKVYNYSNAHQMVAADTVDEFFKKCDDVYPQKDVTLYYGIVE